MIGISDVLAQGESAIQSTNTVFQTTDKPLIISRMTRQDLRLCDNLSRNSEHHLAWQDLALELDRPDGYNFCFKLTYEDEERNPNPNRPQGGCASSYNNFTNRVTIEMIQSFSADDGPLDGKMMAYSLITLIFFVQEVGAEGIYISQPINDDICNYYIDTFDFQPLNGNRALLYRSIEDLLQWFVDYSRDLAEE